MTALAPPPAAAPTTNVDPTPAAGPSRSGGVLTGLDAGGGETAPASEALGLLVEGLAPYVEERLRAVHNDRWTAVARLSGRNRRGRRGGEFRWDAHALLAVLWDQWNSLFRHDLGHAERSLVAELKAFRNRWAHQKRLDFDDTYRMVDSVRRLLRAVGAANLPQVEHLQEGLLEAHVAETVNSRLTMKAFSRNRVRNIGLYAMCVLVIGIQMAAARPSGPVGVVMTGLVSVVVLTFCYLIYQQYRAEPALLYGPRECGRCRKIVYRRECPYCG